MINLKQEHLNLYTTGQQKAPLYEDWQSFLRLYATATESICKARKKDEKCVDGILLFRKWCSELNATVLCFRTSLNGCLGGVRHK